MTDKDTQALLEQLKIAGEIFSIARQSHDTIESLVRSLAQKDEALDNLRLSASRVSSKYGRVGDTDEFSDWTEWVNLREHCADAERLLTPKDADEQEIG